MIFRQVMLFKLIFEFYDEIMEHSLGPTAEPGEIKIKITLKEDGSLGALGTMIEDEFDWNISDLSNTENVSCFCEQYASDLGLSGTAFLQLKEQLSFQIQKALIQKFKKFLEIIITVSKSDQEELLLDLKRMALDCYEKPTCTHPSIEPLVKYDQFFLNSPELFDILSKNEHLIQDGTLDQIFKKQRSIIQQASEKLLRKRVAPQNYGPNLSQFPPNFRELAPDFSKMLLEQESALKKRATRRPPGIQNEPLNPLKSEIHLASFLATKVNEEILKGKELRRAPLKLFKVLSSWETCNNQKEVSPYLADYPLYLRERQVSHQKVEWLSNSKETEKDLEKLYKGSSLADETDSSPPEANNDENAKENQQVIESET